MESKDEMIGKVADLIYDVCHNDIVEMKNITKKWILEQMNYQLERYGMIVLPPPLKYRRLCKNNKDKFIFIYSNKSDIIITIYDHRELCRHSWAERYKIYPEALLTNKSIVMDC